MNTAFIVELLNATHKGDSQLVGIASTNERAMFLAANVSIIDEHQQPIVDIDGGLIYSFDDEDGDLVQIKITAVKINRCLICNNL